MSHFNFHPEQAIASFSSRFPELIAFWQEEIGSGPAHLLAEHSWIEACKQVGKDPICLLGKFALRVSPGVDHRERDWTLATLDELVDEIVSNHHSYVRVQLGRMVAISCYIARMEQGNGMDHLVAQFNDLSQSLLLHLEMEELNFFPNCLRLENYQDTIGRQELDELIDLLQHTTHDHHLLDGIELGIRGHLDAMIVSDDLQHPLRALREALDEFMVDAVIHSEKEDGVLIPAIMFAHDIRRSDSESGRLKAT